LTKECQEVVVECKKPVISTHQNDQHADNQNCNLAKIEYPARVSHIAAPTRHVAFVECNNEPVRRQSHRVDPHYPTNSVSYSHGNNNNVVSRGQYGTRSDCYVERMPTSSVNQRHIPNVNCLN